MLQHKKNLRNQRFMFLTRSGQRKKHLKQQSLIPGPSFMEHTYHVVADDKPSKTLKRRKVALVAFHESAPSLHLAAPCI